MRSQTSLKAELFARALRMGILGVFALFAIITLVSLLCPVSTSAATSSTVNFQARLETAGGALVPDGNYNVEFKLYDLSTSSGSSQGSCTGDADCLWVETRTGANQVRVVNGYLTVNLGSVSAFGTLNWNQQMWLTMRIGGTGTPSWDAEMSPRIQLTATPYSFQAGELGNGTSRATLDASGNLVFQQASTVKELSAGSGTALTIQGGTATVGTNVGGNLLLQGGAGASTGASGSVIVKPAGNDSTTAFQVQNASSVAVLTVDTTNQRVGIGTASPGVRLDVATSGGVVGIQVQATDAGYTAIRSKNTAYAGYDYGIVGATPPAGVPVNGFYVYDVQQNAYRWSINPTTGNMSVGGAFTTNAQLSLGTAVTTNKLYLYDNTSDKYGFGIAANTLQVYSGAGASTPTIAFGKYDGTTFTELDRFQNGSLGVGNVNPQYKIDVTGTGRIAATSTTAFMVQNGSNANVLSVDTTDKFVGIGTASTPRTTLDVVTADVSYGGAIIENTDTANTAAGFAPLIIQHDANTNGSSAGIRFRLNNSSSAATTYGFIGAQIQDATSVIGQLAFGVQSGGTLVQPMIINPTGVAIVQGGSASFAAQYALQVVGDTNNQAVGPLVVQSTSGGSSIGAALTLDASPASGGHKWSFLSTGPGAAAGAGSFSFFDGTADAYRVTIGTTGNVGIGITAPTNLFQVGPFDASGSATRTNSSAALIGSGTGWSNAQVGDIIVFPGGTTNTVASVTDATHLTMGTTYTGTTDGSPVAFTMYKPAFNVTSSGNTYAQGNSTSQFQVQNASSGSLFNVDTTNTAITINAAQNGATGAFATNSNALPLPGSVNAYYQTAVTSANGYIYVLGGADTALTSTSAVYYAKLNADGSTGSWTTNSNSLPAARRGGSALTNNGYIYYLGGKTGSGEAQDVYYAKLNADGSTGQWATSNQPIPQSSGLNVGPVGFAAANGYLYSVGNYNSPYNNVYYAKFNADGNIGAWVTSANHLLNNRFAEAVVVANGYLYAIGGINNATGATVSSTEYAPLNADGSIGTWTATTSMPNPRNGAASGVANGYVYVAGGYDGTTQDATVYYAKLNANGTIGTWSCQGTSAACNITPTNSNALAVAEDSPGGAMVNGYLYVLGGGVYSSASYNTVYYAPIAKVQIAGDLDLIGLTSGQLTGPSQTGGTIYAGNIFSNGNLSVQGNSRFWNGLSLSGNLSATGDVMFRSAANSATAFVVQDTSSNQIFGVDTSAEQVLLGKPGTYDGKLVFYSGTASNTNTVTIKSGNTSASYSITLPTAVGSSGQCLKANDNSGTLIFGSCGSGTTNTVILAPEFAGATFSQYGGDGTTSGTNTGFMQSDHYVSGTAKHNYYQWSTDQASAQDYHVITEYQLPSTFGSFASGTWKIWTYVDSLTSTNLQFTIYSNNNTACYSSLQSIKPSSATAWQQISIADPGNGCTFAANDVITIDIKMTAIQPQTQYVKVGELQFGYN